MYAFLAPLGRLFSAVKPATSRNGVAQQLMDRAEARAGLDPQQAQELRDAAYAYLRVVR
jgi:hypothetical protein